MTANRRPQWRPPPSLPTPHHRSWNELPGTLNAGEPSPGPADHNENGTLAARTPDLVARRSPTGTPTWAPHPLPHPSVPAASFWSGVTVFGADPASLTAATTLAQPLNPTTAAHLTGGWPLPGTSPGVHNNCSDD